MDLITALETFAFATFAFICRPVTWAVEAWGERLDRIAMEGIEEYSPTLTEDCLGHEPTVSDIRPAGMVQVHAMDETGKWQQLHDYPVRLLPKVPGIEIRGGEKQ